MKLHFQKNQYPSKEDKEAIINIMQHKFESKIDINQLSRWFQVFTGKVILLICLARKRKDLEASV